MIPGGYRNRTMTCAFEVCDRPLGDKGGKAEGLCTAHYMQKKRGQELKPLRPRSPNGTVPPPKPTVAPEVRAWAKENGIDVPARGKIPWQVMEDWRNSQD